jgi:hypothetical protein
MAVLFETTLEQLVERAKLQNGCARGHDWESVGGRPCGGDFGAEACQGSQTVYQCARCGEYDYGHEPGPGYDDCVKHCRVSTASNRRADSENAR